ncbi:leucine--tRNA ligase [Microbacterium sp. STN6]|uniref:leucine--tRNA ligase n=1 Tax=Microbacterium sp. STN6 TaxID=2995588 RepID=UPI0022608FDA|nr:leucine--tRNA ligase [Microbacterium sp. STN6]MCX7522290.1 leucine--tRNA ligase [Microbacterium sp. STN6]
MTNEHDTGRSDEARYDFRAIQEKWLPVWEQLKPFATNDVPADRPRKYVLDMFPYPSGDLHMGHAEAYALGDVIARFWRQQGFSVLHPIGWDAFGLPAENAAIKRGLDPRGWTYDNIAQQKASMRRYAPSFDWDRVIQTCDPEYYRWNQWLFLKLYEKGLAYRKASLVNWCPFDQTVLANEQVVGGRCERCDNLVTKKKLTQWYFRITEYADRLLDDLAGLEATWPSKVISMQRNWIGRSTGADVDFRIEGREQPVSVYTTRPDTLYGATFMVVAPDADLAAELVEGSSAEVRERFDAYLERVRGTTEMDRLSTEREKTGVFLERYAINPVNGERLPIWAADYVLADYGHGAIMAVPAHDQRDLDFARAFGLPVRVVVETSSGADADGVSRDPQATGEALAGDGVLVNSGEFDGLSKAEAIQSVTARLREQGLGEPATNFRLRDWLISRQRYWGTPIPIIHCPACGEVPVPEDQLPVELPSAEGLDLQPKGTSPLGAAEEWVNVSCPSCGGDAKRDTDTMDTFVDSSWYFLRFLSPHDDTQAFDPAEAKKWAPVDQYVGGVTHAILHLLYARFVTKVLNDLGYIDFGEPFTALLNQGMVLMDGSAMSKSRGNLVRLSDQLDEHGVDAVRLTMAFAGPPEDDIDWADVSPAGSAKFLARAWRVGDDVTSAPDVDRTTGDAALRRVTHHFLADAPSLVEAFKFNVVVARLMELVNATRKAIDTGAGAADPAVREAAETIALALNLFAPYTAEDMWQRLGYEPSVALAQWPAPDASLLVEQSVTSIIQVDGKVRDRLEVSPRIDAEELEALARASQAVQRTVADREIVNVIVRAPRVVNIATRPRA